MKKVYQVFVEVTGDSVEDIQNQLSDGMMEMWIKNNNLQHLPPMYDLRTLEEYLRAKGQT